MLVSCKYCGRMHERGIDCADKPRKEKRITKADRFRWTSRWQKKREEILDRDKYLCQVCLDEGRYEYKDLSIHHIVPILKRWELRLDDSNLVCLCGYHHEQAEKGDINKETLYKLIEGE